MSAPPLPELIEAPLLRVPQEALKRAAKVGDMDA